MTYTLTSLIINMALALLTNTVIGRHCGKTLLLVMDRSLGMSFIGNTECNCN